MSSFFQTLLRFLLHLGYFGPFVMGVMDSSFLFLPFGNDLLVVAMVARHHQGYLLYVISAVCGSTLGVFLLDLVARKGGEVGVQKLAGPKLFRRLKAKMSQRGAVALVTGCLAPPPFPFTMMVATESALGFPKWRLLGIVAAARASRFLLLGFLALKFGRQILRIMSSTAFKWSMAGFIALCLIGSIFSILKWIRSARRQRVG